MRLISWNVAGRVKRCEQQVNILNIRGPDLIALQEITQKSDSLFKNILKDVGFDYIISSAQLAYESGRRYGELIASRFPFKKLTPSNFDIPYPERVLSANINTPWGLIEFHTAHIPPGSSNGWIKIDTFEGIYNRLAINSDIPRILCGDFSSPQSEKPGGIIVTWGKKKNQMGKYMLNTIIIAGMQVNEA